MPVTEKVSEHVADGSAESFHGEPRKRRVKICCAVLICHSWGHLTPCLEQRGINIVLLRYFPESLGM